MTNNELIKELLKYDGWEITETNTANRYRFFVGEELEKACHIFNHLELSTQPMLHAYLTDMNILHRIAVKVVRELFTLNVDNDDYTKDMDIKEVKSWIDMSMYNYPNEQGEHIQLAEAIVNAIRYISANKA